MRDLYGRVPKNANKTEKAEVQGDIALILSLIILLLGEGGDTILILALIYILT